VGGRQLVNQASARFAVVIPFFDVDKVLGYNFRLCFGSLYGGETDEAW
jgi:hypothetical protein